jgi:hypothetical protein
MADMDDIEPGVVAPRDDFSDIEVARLIGRVMTNAAKTLGIDYQNMRFDELGERILWDAQGGKLDPESYAVVWLIVRDIFKAVIH